MTECCCWCGCCCSGVEFRSYCSRYICRFCLSMKLNRCSNSDENQFNRLRNGVFTYGMVQPTVCDTLFQYVRCIECLRSLKLLVSSFVCLQFDDGIQRRWTDKICVLGLIEKISVLKNSIEGDTRPTHVIWIEIILNTMCDYVHRQCRLCYMPSYGMFRYIALVLIH